MEVVPPRPSAGGRKAWRLSLADELNARGIRGDRPVLVHPNLNGVGQVAADVPVYIRASRRISRPMICSQSLRSESEDSKRHCFSDSKHHSVTSLRQCPEGRMMHG
jgi:hypothetical protein